jgi:hypothetical protein
VTRRRRTLFLVILALVITALMPGVAMASSVRDGKEFGTRYDIRYAKLVRPAPHTLMSTIRTWGAWKRAPSSQSPLTLQLDTSGTTSPDDTVAIFTDPHKNGQYCELRHPSQKVIRQGTLRRPDRHTATCRVSTKGIRFKRLHWKASMFIRLSLAGPVIDYAPNSGWINGV